MRVRLPPPGKHQMYAVARRLLTFLKRAMRDGTTTAPAAAALFTRRARLGTWLFRE